MSGELRHPILPDFPHTDSALFSSFSLSLRVFFSSGRKLSPNWKALGVPKATLPALCPSTLFWNNELLNPLDIRPFSLIDHLSCFPFWRYLD